jgi:hypothetical protein
MEPYKLESVRRSLAMLPAQTASLDREEAIRLLAELQEMDKRMRQLREGLLGLVALAYPDAGPSEGAG